MNTTHLRRAHRAAALLATLVCVLNALAGGERAGPVSFLFDGGVTITGGGGVVFDRATPTVGDSGEVIAEGVMRFARPRLLCGAPEVTVVPGTVGPGNINILAANVASDNQTPAYVVFNADWGRLQIHIGTITGDGFNYNTAPNPQKGNASDFLRDSVDNQPDEAWTPKAALICHGSAVLHCNVAKRDSQGRWIANRIGFAVCNFADLAGPKQFWWRRHALSDVLTANTSLVKIGAPWALQNWSVADRDGSSPTKYWVVATDYRNNLSKDGGVWVIFPVSRSGTQASDWSADTLVELPGRFFNPGIDATHAHAAALTRFGEQGLIILGARGDGMNYNPNYTWTIDDEANYRAGASLRLDSYRWLAGATAWSGPRTVNGNLTNEQSDPSLRRLGNQWVSIVPGPQPGSFITGSDESNQSIWMLNNLHDNPERVDYTPLYTASPTNWILPEATSSTTQARLLCFHLKSDAPQSLNARYVAQLGPGQFEPEHLLNARILYSPNGVNWGQCWAHKENEQAIPHIIADRIWAGSWGLNVRQGIRSTPVPAWRLLQPLRTAPGGMNYAAPTMLAYNVGQGNLVTPDAEMSDVPCGGARYEIRVQPTAGGQSSAELGTFRLADNVPGNAGRVRIKLWICPLPTTDGGVAGSTGLQARLISSVPGQPSTTKYSGYSANLYYPGSKVWTPIVLTTDLSAWGSQTLPARLELQARSFSGVCVPMLFRLAIDSVVTTDGLPSPPTPGSAQDDEVVSVRNMSFGQDWSVLLAGMVPPDNWDRLCTEDAPRPLVALVNERGDRWIQLFADAQAKAITAKFWNGTQYDQMAMKIPGLWFTAASPVLLGMTHQTETRGLTYCEGVSQDRYKLYASVGGSIIAEDEARCFGLDGPLTEIRFSSGDGSLVTPMDWFGGRVEGGAMGRVDVVQSLQTLSFLLPSCRVDFDGDGFVTGLDFDLFVGAFESGDANADFDRDGFVTGLDYDGFVGAYEAGC